MTWNAAAKYRNQYIGRSTFDTGLHVPVRTVLRNAGYLEKIKLYHQIAGQYVTAGPTSVDPFGVYAGCIDRITLRANSVADLFDCSGYMAAIISAIDNQYRYGSGSMTPTPPYSFTTTPATAAYTDGWSIDIPVALYLANKPAPYGLVQLALNSMETVLEIRYNPVAVAQQAGNSLPIPGTGLYGGNTANAGTPTGFTDINQCFFDPIPVAEDQPPLGYTHRWREFQYPVGADGDFDLKLPPSNIYLRMIVQYVQGAATALAPNGWTSPAVPGVITRAQLRYGGNLAPYDETAAQLQARMTKQYAFTLPTGVYVWDFLEDTHTERDLIDSAATTDLRLTLTSVSGTYVGGAYYRIAVEELVPLTQMSAGSAGVQGVNS